MKFTPLPFFLGLTGLILFGCQKDPAEEVTPGPEPVYDPTPYRLEEPEWFPLLDIPADNPMTEEGISLGRMLYYDPILHADSAMACASCHVQEFSFSTPGSVLPHLNLGWNSAFLWNGKVQGSLEDIMLFEVKEFFQTDLARLQNHDEYPGLFYQAFGRKTITAELCAKALAQFERTMVSANSKYDRVIGTGSSTFFTDEELSGHDIFFTEKGDCFHCHGGILFTDNDFHNNALDIQPSPGLSEITGQEQDRGKFKTPTLRNIELTAPYMHDGRYQTLEEVIDFYSEGLQFSETADPLMKNLHRGGVHLTPQEKSDLIAFLKTLTDTSYVRNPVLGSPF